MAQQITLNLTENKMSNEYILALLNGLIAFVNDQADVSDIDLLTETLEDGLDDLDNEDFFGTEGWRHSFGLDD